MAGSVQAWTPHKNIKKPSWEQLYQKVGSKVPLLCFPLSSFAGNKTSAQTFPFISWFPSFSPFSLPCQAVCCCFPSFFSPRKGGLGTHPGHLQVELFPGLALGQQMEEPGRYPVQVPGTACGPQLWSYWGGLAGPVEGVRLDQKESDTHLGSLALDHEREASCKQSQGWTVQDWEWSRLGAWTCTGLLEGSWLGTPQMTQGVWAMVWDRRS